MSECITLGEKVRWSKTDTVWFHSNVFKYGFIQSNEFKYSFINLFKYKTNEKDKQKITQKEILYYKNKAVLCRKE